MDKNKFLFKASILSISLLCMAAPAVAATVPNISESLNSVSQASIEMLMSVPNFGILICVMLAPFITRGLGNKPTVMLGLILVLLSGLVPVFTENYPILLISRFILGCGVGLFNSLAYSLISIYYTGEERNKLLGYQAAVSAFASTFLTLAVGFLLGYGWHVSYYVYLIALVPIVLFGLIVPNKEGTSEEDQIKSAEKVIIHKRVVIYAVYVFFIFVSYMLIVYKLASLFVEKGYGTASQASVVLALAGVCGFFSSLAFGKIKSIFKKYTVPVAVGLSGLMIMGIGYSNSVALSTVFVAVAGICSGLFNPSIFSEAAAVSNKASQTAASTCLLVGINLGCFINPTLFASIGKMANNTSLQFAMTAGGAILVICAAINFLTAAKGLKTNQKLKGGI